MFIATAITKKERNKGNDLLEDAFIGFSPRSGRQRKAWGASPRIKEQDMGGARGAGDSCRVLRQSRSSAAARSAGLGSS
jgi:hypothetical protein